MNNPLLLLAASWADLLVWVWQWVMLPAAGLYIIIAFVYGWKGPDE